jgi:hypothetical protein
MEITGDTHNQLPPVQRPIDVAVSGLPCTPTPAPTGTPTLQQPTATAIPIAQIAQTAKNERCTLSIGLLFLNTCLPWGWLAAIIVIVALIIFIAACGWPWYRINKVNPPPAGFLVAYKDGVQVTDVVAVHQVAMKKRKMSLTIGGDRQNADILVDGLPRIEFSVEWNGNVMFLREVDEQEAFAYFKEIPQNILTGDPKITLKICLLEDPLKK